jgi:hypothetical protein
MLKIVRALAILAMMAAPVAQADWHGGRLTGVFSGYEGTTISFTTEGYSRTNCTYNSAWPNQMCLNRSRANFSAEVALLYSVRARGGLGLLQHRRVDLLRDRDIRGGLSPLAIQDEK